MNHVVRHSIDRPGMSEWCFWFLGTVRLGASDVKHRLKHVAVSPNWQQDMLLSLLALCHSQLLPHLQPETQSLMRRIGRHMHPGIRSPELIMVIYKNISP